MWFHLIAMCEPLPFASVIVPVRNQPREVEGCYVALKQQDYPRECYEILVVDYGSTDGTAALVRRWRGGIVLDRPAGLGEAVAAAAAVARGEVLVLTQPGCVPSETWLRRLVEALAEEEADVAQGDADTWQRGVVPRFAALEFRETYREWTHSERPSSLDGCGIAVRRERWDKAGVPAPLALGADGFDCDLAWRLEYAKATQRLAPGAVAYRRYEEQLSAWAARQFRLGQDVGALVVKRGLSVLGHIHRPGTVKIQVGLVLLTLVNLLLLLAAPPDAYFYANLVVFILFLISTSGLISLSLRRDPGLVLWLPGLIVARAGLCTFGLVVGLLRGLVNRPLGQPD